MQRVLPKPRPASCNHLSVKHYKSEVFPCFPFNIDFVLAYITFPSFGLIKGNGILTKLALMGTNHPKSHKKLEETLGV